MRAIWIGIIVQIIQPKRQEVQMSSLRRKNIFVVRTTLLQTWNFNILLSIPQWAISINIGRPLRVKWMIQIVIVS